MLETCYPPSHEFSMRLLRATAHNSCDVELVLSLPKDALALTGNPQLRFGFVNANPLPEMDEKCRWFEL